MIQILPGDGIIYTNSNLFDDIQKVKMGSDATHFEVCVGPNKVVTSLLKNGVGIYDQCADTVLRVIRPVVPFYINDALDLFRKTIEGFPYGVEGLLNFTDQNIPDVGMFCSQVGTLFYRGGMLEPFNPMVQARKVAPMHYLYASEQVFKIAWPA